MITGGNGVCVKSKQSSIEFDEPSRSVSDERPNAVSMSFNGDVRS
jgi:hypothetical protein